MTYGAIALGGHAAGEIAAAAAVEIVLRELRANRDVLSAFVMQADFYNRARATDVVEMAIETANREIYRMASAAPERHGMAATIAVVLLLGQSAIVAHVGDSRVYIHRNGGQHQLTLDHSLTRLKLRLGLIAREEAESVRVESALTRAVGAADSLEVDTLQVELMPGDTFLLCSDGLSDYFITGEEFSETLGSHDLEEVPSQLINLANESGGKDNITAVVVQVIDCHTESEDINVAFKIEALSGIPLFATLSYREIVILLEPSRIREFDTGQRILTEGADGDELFVVLSGVVDVSSGQQKLAQLSRGGFFGEMSLIDRAPRSADVDAVKPCQMMVIGRDDFDRLVNENPLLGVKLLRSFCRVLNDRLRNTSHELARDPMVRAKSS
jgi:serine/threonine protein phosphatase PrpC